MPTYAELVAFQRDHAQLTREERAALRRAVGHFVADLRRRQFRPGLRVKGVQGHPGVYEMTWADDGRATFQYGAPVRNNDPHIIWRRVGHHDSLRKP